MDITGAVAAAAAEAVAATAVAAAAGAAFLCPSFLIGGGEYRREGRWREEADHREGLVLQLALLQTGLTRKRKRPPLEGKQKIKKQRRVDGRQKGQEQRADIKATKEREPLLTPSLLGKGRLQASRYLGHREPRVSRAAGVSGVTGHWLACPSQ